MSIIRSPRQAQNFTIVSNSVCLDSRLSMRALGLLIRLLSRPDNWKTTSETIAREFDCGREQVRSVLRELAESGYMILKKEQNEQGHWSSSWFVFDTPNSPTPEAKEPERIDPKPGKPEPGKPYAGELGAITRTDLTSTDNNTSLSSSTPDCPHEEIIDLFCQHLPEAPHPRKSLWRNGKNAPALKARWRWVMTACHESGARKGQRIAATREDGIAWFGKFFAYVSTSSWLTGKAGSWMADLGWLSNSSNFEKVIQGNFENKGAQQ